MLGSAGAGTAVYVTSLASDAARLCGRGAPAVEMCTAMERFQDHRAADISEPDAAAQDVIFAKNDLPSRYDPNSDMT